MELRYILIVSILLFGCETTGTNETKLSPVDLEIRELVAKISDSYTKEDVEGLLSCFHPDASIMHSGKARIKSSVAEYRNILPEKIKKYPGMEIKVKRIKVKLQKAKAYVNVKQGKYDWDQVFNLVKYEDKWKILNWDY